MEPWVWVIVAVAAVLVLLMLFRRSSGGRRTVVMRRPARHRRRGAAWVNRSDPKIGELRVRTGNPEYAVPGTVVVQTYGEYFEEFLMHPETKALGPDGRPCDPWTNGLLSPRHITASGELQRIGKEVNRLADHSDLSDGRLVEYPAPACRGCGKPVSGQRAWCSEACRKREARKRGARLCRACHRPLMGRRRDWCSERCRKRASRQCVTVQPSVPISELRVEVARKVDVERKR